MPIESSPDLTHSCSEIINLTYPNRTDSLDQTLVNPDKEKFPDGSNFVQSGQWTAGYEVISLHNTIEAQPLPLSTSAQKAKIMALIQALILGQGKRILSIQIPNMPSLFCTLMLLYRKKEGSLLLGIPPLNMNQKSKIY